MSFLSSSKFLGTFLVASQLLAGQVLATSPIPHFTTQQSVINRHSNGSGLLPLNGKILFVGSCKDARLTEADGTLIETLETSLGMLPNRDSFCSLAPKNGFRAGQEIRFNSSRENISFIVRETSVTSGPAVPVLTELGSSRVSIQGNALAYSVEDDKGLLGVVYDEFENPSSSSLRLRAIAIDEAGNQSQPSDWLTVAQKVPADSFVDHEGAPYMPYGCSSSQTSSSALLAIFSAIIFFLQTRRRQLQPQKL